MGDNKSLPVRSREYLSENGKFSVKANRRKAGQESEGDGEEDIAGEEGEELGIGEGWPKFSAVRNGQNYQGICSLDDLLG
jgi:hypothetical protein